MKTTAILTLLVLFCVHANAADDETMTDERFRVYFDDVTINNNAVVVTLRKGGARFLYSIDKSEPKKSDDGQQIVVPLGSTLTLVEKHTRIVFSPLAEPLRKKGVFVEELMRDKLASASSKKAILLLFKPPVGNQSREKSYQLLEPDVEKAKKSALSN